jgi:hypothetical protein
MGSFADASAKQRRGLIEEFERLCRQFIMMNGWLTSDFGGKLREDRLFLCRWFFGCSTVRVCCHTHNLEHRMPDRYA